LGDEEEEPPKEVASYDDVFQVDVISSI